MRRCRLLVTGASGAGTTTLARTIANEWSVPHADVDDYFWVPSSPPYSVKRPVPSRLDLMNEIFLPRNAWVDPLTKPVQVRLVKASPGRGTAIISWRLPANNGGSKITGYRVARNGRDTTGHGAYQTLVKPSKHAIKVTRLYKGRVYIFKVAAINKKGQGPWHYVKARIKR